MEVVSLNTNKQKVAIIDSYKSFIWNDRYEDLGDFELYIPADAVETLANIHQDYFIQCTESDRTMVVEKVNYKTDLEDGSFVVISGHSLESILKRRIVWNDDGKPTQINATKILDPTTEEEDSGSDFPLYLAIEYLLRLYIIDPEACGNKPNRKIDDFIFETPTDIRILSIMMSPCSYQGDNLYDLVRNLCSMYEISFKVTMNDSGQFVFALYKGISHLASQNEHPYICFSSDFDNLLTSDSSIDMATYKNMAYYKGNGTKYVVNEFSEEEITMETGFVRIKNNKVWAVNTDYGQNEDISVLDWTPDEFNEKYDSDDDPPVYNTYNVGNTVSKTDYGGALITEGLENEGIYYLTTEPELPEQGDAYYEILLYSTGYTINENYYKCTQKISTGSPAWFPNKWDRVDIRVTWGAANYPEFDPGTEEEPKEHKDGDVVKHNGSNYRCIKKYSGEWIADNWIPVITHNVLDQVWSNKHHSLWEECENWNNHKQYSVGNFVTFNDASRTGKITIYRKSNPDAKYNKKNKYSKNAVVWFNNGKSNDMYIRNKYKAGKKKGVAPTNTKYWTKIKDKYKTFNAQQWEALSDIQTEQYDIYGSVQDENVGGLDRREMYVDVSSVPSTYDYFYDGKENIKVDWLVDDGVYKATVKDMALAELAIPGNRMTKGFEAEIDYHTNFQYRKDYSIGDIIEIRDIYGYIDSVRVKEFIISDDDNGIKCYPSYETVESSTITTRLLEVNDELLGNTFLVKIPESTKFVDTTLIATAVKNDTTYYLKSFVKKITTDSEVEPGKKVRRNLHLVAWITTDDIYTNYEEQAPEELLKSHPTMVGEPLFYIDIDEDTGMKIPGILFPSWAPPYGTDLGLITSINTYASQYKNILLANI